ncbi:DUF5979 domain-containing protein [Microbacterium sp. Marseille-Q6965]|uniref:DUF5979 domain-containing protein n=1 Tax=Microbacterium sp. Marseille-Q6965 TaxID=2965072 RepID=UPI0021B72FBA|nr:DUF5979 domain-containing protein [Microbacterium sp. Marseille-Q6965]
MRRAPAGLTALALAAGLLLPVAGVGASPASAAPDDVIAAGRVFTDYDGDGVFDDDASDGYREHGIRGVLVTVTDALGRSATTYTNRDQEFVLDEGWVWTSDGDWSMTEGEFAAQNDGEVPFVKAGQSAAQLRVTFSDAPDGYESWFAGDNAQNGTSVQFVTAGDASVDFALLPPDDHRVEPLDVLTAIQSAGDPDPDTPNFIDSPAITSTDWETSQAIHSYVDVDGDGAYAEGTDTFAPVDDSGREYGYYGDADGNGRYDEGEALSHVPYIDENGNNRWDSGPWINPTAYEIGLTDAASPPAVVDAPPVTAPSVRVRWNGGECWTGPLTFTQRLVDPVTVPDGATPRTVAYFGTVNPNCGWANPPSTTLQVIFVPGGFWEGETQYTAFPTTEQTTPEAPRTLAMFSEVGSVWGVAYEQASNTALFSAVYKRLSGLAEHRWGGDAQRALGGIYRIPEVLAPGTGKVAPDVGESGEVQPWFSLTDLGIPLGTAQSNAERGLGAANLVVADEDGFARAGRIGIGAIDTWTDGTTAYLFAMNLNDRNLYRIDISPSLTDGSWAPTPDDVTVLPLGLPETQQPWAVEVRHDDVYVGWADTGTAAGQCAVETGSPVPPGETPPPPCDQYAPLSAHVARLSVEDATAPETVFDFSLGYPRGDPIHGWGGRPDDAEQYSDLNPQTRHWNTWTDTWNWADGSVGIDASAGSAWSSGHYLQVYPQAVVSSLSFDDDGYLSLGLLDRTALQAGNIQRSADPADADQPYYEAVSAGDMLIAGWNEDNDSYVLEDNGIVLSRFAEDGALSQRYDESEEHNSSGPGGREFYDDDQALDASARGAGALNHQEVGLGSVLQLPGATEIATTAFDPLVNIRVQGLMWLTEEEGTPDRAVELTDDPGQSSTPGASFQKGGGLGDLDALVPPAPVEIGNRVWFDADQDGYQSADEPGVAGLTVELVDAEGDVIGRQTTQADGTYYFSTRDDDPVDHYAPMEYGQDYTVRFVPPDAGTLSVNLWGTTVTVPWAEVPFTEQQVEPVAALANPHDETDNADGVGVRAEARVDIEQTAAPVVDADRIDSNPDVSTGEYPFTLGGVGQNEHSIDAGFLAWAPLDVIKQIDPDGVAAAPGTTFDLNLQISDFRGLSVGVDDPSPDAAYTFEDLAAYEQNAGLVTAADPDGIADGVLTVEVGPDGIVPVARVWVPIGSAVEVVEAPTDAVQSVTYIPEGAVLVDDGDPDNAATIRIVNTMASGAFAVAKNVTGEAADQIADDTAFPMEYSVDGGTTWLPFTIGYDADGDGTPAPWASPEFAAGTEVLVREASPLPAPPEGVTWGSPTISGTGVVFDAETGIASFTVAGDGTTVALTVTNVANIAPPGGFEAVKVITGDAAGLVPEDAAFTLEYSIDDGETWTPLLVTADGTPVGVGDLRLGTVVQLRETATRPAVDGVDWGAVTIAGEGVDYDPESGIATFTIASDVIVELTVSNAANPAVPEPGGFEVLKQIAGTAAANVPPDTVFPVEYSTDGGTTWLPLEVTADGTPVGVDDLAAGTVVLLREADPLPTIGGVVWGDPLFVVDGGAPQTGPVTFTIGEGATVDIVLTNTAEPDPGTFSVRKIVLGAAAGVVGAAQPTFVLEYAIDDDGDAGTVPDFAALDWSTLEIPWTQVVSPEEEFPPGTVVWVREAQPLPAVAGVEWGQPQLFIDGEPVPSPAPLTIRPGDEPSPALTLLNTAAPAPGGFSVTKVLQGDAAEQVPDGTTFTVEYTVDGGAPVRIEVPFGETVTVSDLAAGSEATITEVDLPEIEGIEWGAPLISLDGVPQTGDPVSFEIGAGAGIAVDIVNTAGEAPGRFSATKTVEGDAAGDVPDGTGFLLEYSVDGGDTWQSLTLPVGELVTSGELPAGTQVLVREGALPDIPGVDFGEPTITGSGVSTDPTTGYASFTIGAEETVALGVTNIADPETGGFEAAKALTGSGAGLVPDDATFAVEYSLDDGDTWIPLEVTADGTPVAVGDLPVGTIVQLRETAERPVVGGVEWGDVTIGGTGVTYDAATGVASFTIGTGGAVSVIVTNTAKALGGFAALKQVVGDGAARVPAEATFTLEYSTDDGGTWLPLAVRADGVPVSVSDLPAGTVVQLRETAERPAVPPVQWGPVTISGEGVDYDADSGTATFTIGGAGTVTLTVTNTAELAPGAFAVTKLLSGSAAGEVPAGTEFTIQYALDDGPTRTATIVAGETWASAEIPAGTTVTVSEVELPDVDGAVWGTPAISVDGAPQGATATFVVGAAQTVTVSLTNTATPPPVSPPPPPAAEPAQPGSPLPATGTDGAALSLLVGLAVLLIAAGAFIILRRRLAAAGRGRPER